MLAGVEGLLRKLSRSINVALPHEDRMQIARMHALQAIRSWDPTRGTLVNRVAVYVRHRLINLALSAEEGWAKRTVSSAIDGSSHRTPHDDLETKELWSRLTSEEQRLFIKAMNAGPGRPAKSIRKRRA